MTESELTKRLTAHWSESGMVLYRNQTGTYQLRDGRWLSSGLCVGSSDLIGWTPVIVTQAMVGKPLAVFTAVEEKTLAYPRLTDDQRNWLDQVTRAGGLAYVARETADGPLLNRWPEPLKVARKKT